MELPFPEKGKGAEFVFLFISVLFQFSNREREAIVALEKWPSGWNTAMGGMLTVLGWRETMYLIPGE
jgi:hypothetical protein